MWIGPVATGETLDAEEAVLADYSTGSAGTRELPEREEQLACHASEGKSSLCMPML